MYFFLRKRCGVWDVGMFHYLFRHHWTTTVEFDDIWSTHWLAYTAVLCKREVNRRVDTRVQVTGTQRVKVSNRNASQVNVDNSNKYLSPLVVSVCVSMTYRFYMSTRLLTSRETWCVCEHRACAGGSGRSRFSVNVSGTAFNFLCDESDFWHRCDMGGSK